MDMQQETSRVIRVKQAEVHFRPKLQEADISNDQVRTCSNGRPRKGGSRTQERFQVSDELIATKLAPR